MSIHPQPHTNLIQAVQCLIGLAEEVIGDFEKAQTFRDYTATDDVDCTHDPALISELGQAIKECDRQISLTEIYGSEEGK